MLRLTWLLLLLPCSFIGCAEGYSSTKPATEPDASTEAPACPFCAAGSKAAALTKAGEDAAGEKEKSADDAAAADGVGQETTAESNDESQPPVAEDADAPPSEGDQSGVELKVLDDEGIQNLIASKRGQVVVMDCWSTSCPTCVKEFPNLVRLQQTYGDKLACVSLSFDYEGLGTVDAAMPPVRKFLMQQQATFDNIISNVESDELYRKLQLISIPAVFVYDRDGKLAKRFDNDDAKTEADAFTYEQVEDCVRQLLAANP